jgi:hypothetical protein
VLAGAPYSGRRRSDQPRLPPRREFASASKEVFRLRLTTCSERTSCERPPEHDRSPSDSCIREKQQRRADCSYPCEAALRRSRGNASGGLPQCANRGSATTQSGRRRALLLGGRCRSDSGSIRSSPDACSLSRLLHKPSPARPRCRITQRTAPTDARAPRRTRSRGRPNGTSRGAVGAFSNARSLCNSHRPLRASAAPPRKRPHPGGKRKQAA